MTERNDRYNNNEINLMFKDILNKLDNLHSEQTRTTEQVKKTNGRVSALEKWQHYTLGALAVLSILFTVYIGPITLRWLQSAIGA